MSDLLQLRRNERFNPAEFPRHTLEQMHERLDAIAREEDDDVTEAVS